MNDLSPAAAKLLKKLCSPHALTWGGVFLRYDSSAEAAYDELHAAGLAEVSSLHLYGCKVRLAQVKAAARPEIQP